MKKVLAVLILALAFVASAFAQTQTTPYSNNNFSATFNNEVTYSTYSNPTNINYVYTSTSAQGVKQVVNVRIVDHDIPVDYSSSDFYMNHETSSLLDTFDGTLVADGIARNLYQGHPFTYAFFDKAPGSNGTMWSERIRFIIVNSREVIFIYQIAPEEVNDQQEWFAFEETLSIK